MVGRWETRGSSDCSRGTSAAAAAAVEQSDQASQAPSRQGRQRETTWTAVGELPWPDHQQSLPHPCLTWRVNPFSRTSRDLGSRGLCARIKPMQ